MATRRCWNCDSIAHMTLIPSSPRQIASSGRGHTAVQSAFQCDECKWLSLGATTRFTANDDWVSGFEHWVATDAEITWWPAVGVSRPFEDVPEHIASAASEAHRCYSIEAYRGATALARSVVEASAKAKGITSGTLFHKIEELEKAGHVRAHIRDAAHEVRHLGNDVAHGDFVDPIVREEAEETLALMAEVLQEVFQSPARIAKARAAREAKKAGRQAS